MIVRPYTPEQVSKLQGKTVVEHTLAKLGAKRLWNLLESSSGTDSLGAVTGAQAVQYAKAGLGSIYVSGWQVAADANLNGQTYPDQSLYAANSVPALVKRINNALLRAEQVDWTEGNLAASYMLPVIADAEAGFGGPLNAFELMKAMIESGAAGVHFEDQLSSVKKCGHMGGKCLVPTSEFVRTLVAARLAADVCNVNTVIVGRTDADSAKLITSDVDERDAPFIDRAAGRTPEGYYVLGGRPIDRCVARALAYAPYCDVLWMETSTPDLNQAKQFAERVHEKFPGKLLAYNLSPSFNWSSKLDPETIQRFTTELNAMGFKWRFITLAGYHANCLSTFQLAWGFARESMPAYVRLQDEELGLAASRGYTAAKHQREAAAGYYDLVSEVISGGQSSTLALEGSTEAEQF